MAADATRCARPDCISLREEVELLRGDLRELAAESDALHDALAAKDADAQRIIAAKDDDLARLSRLVEQLTSQVAAAAAVATPPQTAAVATIVERPEPAQQTDGAVDRLARECEELRAANAALETQLRELRAGAGTREKTAAAAAAADAKDKRSELLRVLQENEQLRSDKGALEAALRSTAEAARENEALVKALYTHQSAYKDAVDEQTIEITQLHAKLEQLEHEKAQLEAKLIEMDEREGDVEVLLQDAKRKHDAEKAVLRNERNALQKRVGELEQQRKQQQQQKQQKQTSESATASDRTATQTAAAVASDDVEAMERQLELLQELRIRDKNTIAELNHRVLQQQSDLESLMEHLDVDTAIESAVQSAVAQEEVKSARMRQEHSNMKRRLKEQSDLLREAEFRQAQLEKELAEAREWNARYECNAGLEDVMKFQKQLRKQLETQQRANAKLRQELSEQIEAAGKLHVAFERLKAECGKASDFHYDDLAVENHLKGELAMNQAVIVQMEHQLQELETDRVRLLQKLREQARVTGQKLYEAHGVTTEQWHLVEEFIDRVKHTPEVAKRMLTFAGRGAEGGGVVDVADTGVGGGGGGSSEQRLDQDAVVRYETEISNAHADNMKLAAESEEEMTLQLDVLKELNVCLDELVRSESQNEALQQQLAQHEHAFRTVVDQHTVLYQHFFHMHAEYSKSDEQLQSEVSELKSANHDLQLKCQRYESSLHLFALQQREGTLGVIDTETQMRSEIIELTRQNAIYEVNEARFRRKYQQLHHDLQASRSQKKALEQDWLEMEKTLKYRILYLESWKQGADDLIERMEKTLEKSVLKTFAERQEVAAVQILGKYNALSEAFGEMRIKFVQMYDLPNQISRVQHENALLLAEKRASSADKGRGSSGGSVVADPALQARISELEHELAVQIQRVKEMEEAQASSAAGGAPLPDQLRAGTFTQSSNTNKLELYESDLEKENALLYERISEVEQLYESLTRECAKYKDIAALAASQANTLARRATQEKGKRDEQEEDVRDLMAASDDHALVGRLQQQLMQLKANYQQFLVKYDIMAEDQQHAAIKAQHLELELESRSRLLSDVRDKARNQVAVLETTLAQVKERDLTVRNTKWEAFRKRLDAIEEAMRLEQDRRKQLEKELEERQAQLPLLSTLKTSAAESGHSLEVSRLKSRIEALETRERVLMGQLESAAKSATYLEQEEMLQAELADTKKLNDDMLRQLKTAQGRITELIKQNGELESSRRQAANEKEDLEIELQQAHAQLELLGGGNQSESGRPSNQSGSHSPLMRKKVGLYEKDQADLQQAAQATIASLKLLVEEKNSLIHEYQKKMAAARHDAAQVKAQDRVETTQLNRKLYEENQRMISQLKEAMDTIKHLERTGKDKKAIQAAQERHEHVLKEWKQAEMLLEKTKQRVKELEMEAEVLRNERDIAEARAGEALEEIVLTKDMVAEQERAGTQLETQLMAVKRDMAKKEDKMKLLRDALIKLKEEFLKAEDRHAVELAKAQQAASAAGSRQKKDRREEAAQWREDKQRLESQVQILQEKLELQRKQHERALVKRERVAATKANEKEKAAAAERKLDDSDGVAAQKAALESEVERLKRLVKEQAVSEARAMEDLEKKLRVLAAQNRALREASVASAAPALESAVSERVGREKQESGGADESVSRTREQWEAEKKLQRRNELLAARLKEKQSELDETAKELGHAKERLHLVQQELAQLRKAEQKRAAAGAGATTAVVSLPASVKEQIDDLERQNHYLQETLVLKRREWEEAFAEQMDKYERDLKRLRRRLSQHGVSLSSDAGGSTESLDRTERLRLEEQQYLVSQEVNDELGLLGDELQAKEQEVIEKDTRIMETELELETMRLELKRLQRKCVALESAQQQPPSTRRGVSGPKVKTGGSIRSPAQERLELEEVIENMKRVIEKLRAENEKLKKHCVSPGKLELLRRKVKEHRDARERLEHDVERLSAEVAELKKEKLRLQHKLRVASSTLTATQRPGTGSEEELRELQAGLREKEEELAAKETETRELKRTIAGNEALIQELQLQLETSNAAGGGNDASAQEQISRELEQHVQELEEENAKLQNELAAFDEEFFEEIEDLKYKYAQAVREKRELERRIGGH